MNFKRLHPIRMAWVFLWVSGKLLEQTENFIDKLAPGALVELPVGIKKRVGNTMVMVRITAKKALDKGLDWQTISDLTGFDWEDIERSSKGKKIY